MYYVCKWQYIHFIVVYYAGILVSFPFLLAKVNDNYKLFVQVTDVHMDMLTVLTSFHLSGDVYFAIIFAEIFKYWKFPDDMSLVVLLTFRTLFFIFEF